LGWAVLGSKQGIEALEGILGPNAESTQVSSRGELQQVQVLDGNELNTRNVSEGLDERTLLVVNDQRTTALDVSSVSELTLSGSDAVGFNDSFDIIVSVEGLQQSNGLLGLINTFNELGVNDQRDFGNLVNLVTTGHDQSWDSGGSQSRGNSVSSLVDWDLNVPLSPGLGWCKHSTTTAHVSKSSLARSGSTSSRNTRDTGYSSTSTPRFC